MFCERGYNVKCFLRKLITRKLYHAEGAVEHYF